MQRQADEQMKAGESTKAKAAPPASKPVTDVTTMMHHDILAKAQASRELREERARAFWQAQINEGRARAAEQQANTNTPAAPRQDPPPSPPPPPTARVPLHVVSADTTFTGTAPPISPPDIPALFLAATSFLSLPASCDQCRPLSDCCCFCAAPQAKDRAAWRLVLNRSPDFDRSRQRRT